MLALGVNSDDSKCIDTRSYLAGCAGDCGTWHGADGLP